MKKSNWKRLSFFGALVLPLFCTGLQLLLWESLSPFVWVLYFPAVFFCSWLGGRLAGILATIISVVSAMYFFIPPRFSFAIGSTAGYVSAALFFGMGVLFSFTHASWRQASKNNEDANAKLRTLNQELEKRIDVRTQALRNAIDEMERSEKMYRLLAENVSDVIWILDVETKRFRYVSPSVTRLRGYTAAEVVAEPFEKTLTPSASEHIQAIIGPRIEAFLHGQQIIYRDDIEQICRDGRVVHTETVTRFVRNPESGHIEIVGTSRDITERKKMEDVLVHHEQILRETGRIAKVGGWEFDPTTGEGTWTEEVARIHGLPPNDPTNTKIGLSFYEEPYRTMISGAVAAAASEGKPFDLELELVTRQGLKKWVRTIGDPVVENGKVMRVRGAFLDITEQKRTEQTIRELASGLEIKVAERTSALEASNRELESFSYSVSHDLRAPLRAIEGFTRVISDEHAQAMGEEGRALLQRVIKASQRMSDLIDDLLVLARLSRAEINRQPLDLSEMAGLVIEELRQNQGERQIEVSITPGMTAYGDAKLMRTVLENLLGNAWKFTSKVPVAKIEMACGSGTATETVCCVSDNGAGFEMEYAGKLFGVFQRLHSTGDFPGMGVGLASVQRVIRRHGGRVWAEGSPGQGARFYFSLPLQPGTEESVST